MDVSYTIKFLSEERWGDGGRGAKSQGDGWLMAKLVARLLATAQQLIGFESRHISKIQNGDKNKGKPTHSSPPKKIFKKLSF